MEEIVKVVRRFINDLNEKGIPIPLLRIEGKPSLTATFAFLAFNTALFGQFGKFAKLTGTIDLDSANYLFFGTLAAYLGRRMSGSKSKLKIDSKEKEE